MALFDLLGRRWAMGILWQLSRGPATFRGIQSACESISPAILNARLKDLRQAGLVLHGEGGYRLTELGRELYGLLEPFGTWAFKWGQTLAPEEVARWKAAKDQRSTSEP
nr:helix-turn-helix domain-containing protein [uncultured Holophaga sp.]